MAMSFVEAWAAVLRKHGVKCFVPVQKGSAMYREAMALMKSGKAGSPKKGSKKARKGSKKGSKKGRKGSKKGSKARMA